MKHADLDNFHIKDVKNELHPSVFFKDNEYDLFILRLPTADDNEPIEYKSFAFVITEQSYFYYDKKKDEFFDLENMHEFYKFIDNQINNTMKLTSSLATKVSDLEELVYEANTKNNFNTVWFSYKNDLIRINRVLYKAIEAIEDIMYRYKNEDDYLERNFEDLREHLQRAYRNVGHNLEKLDTIFSFYQTQVNEQSNKIVYILTLLSGIFLPLNFIVGFFGMNTTSLPFTSGDNGTVSVITILILTGLIATLITLLMRRK